MDLFTTQQLQRLNDLELTIYKYVLQNMDKINQMRIRDLAGELHCSTTTILRFCRKLDCNGYAEFKLRLKILQNEVAADLFSDDDENATLQYFRNKNPQVNDQIDVAASLIARASQVILMGMGTSGIMAKFGARYLSNMGKLVHYVDDPFYPVPDEVHQDFVIIIISTSGETKEMIDKINRFKALNATTIAITNSASSTMAKISDCSLAYYVPIEKKADQLGACDMTTQVPVVYLIEKLGKAVYKLIKADRQTK